VLSSEEVGRALDKALAGPLPETVVRSLVERHVVERVVEQIFDRADLEGAIASALDRAETERLVQATLSSPGFERLAPGAADSLLASKLPGHVIESAEMQQLVEEIATSPSVRTALVRSTATLGTEVSAGLRRRMENLDSASERTVQGWFSKKAELGRREARAQDAYGGLGVRGHRVRGRSRHVHRDLPCRRCGRVARLLDLGRPRARLARRWPRRLWLGGRCRRLPRSLLGGYGPDARDAIHASPTS
jgi:hypothetical protein